MFPPTSHHQPWSVATWPKFVTVPRLFHQVPDTTVRPEDCYLARWDGWPGGDSSSAIVLLFWPCFWTCCWIATKIWFQLFQHIDLRLIWSFHQISGLHGYVIGKSPGWAPRFNNPWWTSWGPTGSNRFHEFSLEVSRILPLAAWIFRQLQPRQQDMI